MKNSKRKIRVEYSDLKTQYIYIYIQFPKNQGILNLFIDKIIL
jgi:hypothetical protein